MFFYDKYNANLVYKQEKLKLCIVPKKVNKLKREPKLPNFISW